MLNKETKEALKSALLKLGIEIPVKKIEPPIKLENVTLTDGTILSVDKMEVGATATFTGADGVSIPAEGEYELPDGSSIICVAGLITEIKPAGSDIQPEPLPGMAAQLEALSNRLNSFESKFNESQKDKTSLEAQLTETKKSLKVALEAIDTIDKNSVALALEKQTKEKKSFEEMTELEKFRASKEKK